MSAQGVMLEHLGPSEQHSLVGPRRLDGNAPPPLAIDSVESVIKRTAGEENAGQARRRRHGVVDDAGAGVARAAQTRFAALQAVQAAHKAVSILPKDFRLTAGCGGPAPTALTQLRREIASTAASMPPVPPEGPTGQGSCALQPIGPMRSLGGPAPPNAVSYESCLPSWH